MNCVFCTIDDGETVAVKTEKRGTLYVCAGCLADLLDAELDDLENAEGRHCAGCPNYNGSGRKYPGVTWKTCS